MTSLDGKNWKNQFSMELYIGPKSGNSKPSISVTLRLPLQNKCIFSGKRMDNFSFNEQTEEGLEGEAKSKNQRILESQILKLGGLKGMEGGNCSVPG